MQLPRCMGRYSLEEALALPLEAHTVNYAHIVAPGSVNWREAGMVTPVKHQYSVSASLHAGWFSHTLALVVDLSLTEFCFVSLQAAEMILPAVKASSGCALTLQVHNRQLTQRHP